MPVSAARLENAWARLGELARDRGPGLAFAAAVAVAGVGLAPLVARVAPIPAMVLALVVGIALSGVGARPVFREGLAFAVKTLLRWAVALLGLRIALGDIAALGVQTAVLVVVAMALTLAAGVVTARALGKDEALGALAGSATAVCGASAALATSTVLPDYRGKEADIVFVVIAVNALSTAAMLLYPPIGVALGFDAQTLGVLLGGTIHDVAQVVGAGYAVGEATGNTAVVVKLFRVFLLLPVVLAVGWWFARRGRGHGAAHVAVPGFALVFLALCAVNSAMAWAPWAMPVYGPLRGALVELSSWGLLVAIGALGLGTSLTAIARLGWRHILLVLVATAVILAVVTAAIRPRARAWCIARAARARWSSSSATRRRGGAISSVRRSCRSTMPKPSSPMRFAATARASPTPRSWRAPWSPRRPTG